MRIFDKPYIPNVSSFFPDKSLNKNLLPQVLMHLSISDWGSVSKANSHWYDCAHQEGVMKSVGQHFQDWFLRNIQNRPDIFSAFPERSLKIGFISSLADLRVSAELKILFLGELKRKNARVFQKENLILSDFLDQLMSAFKFLAPENISDPIIVELRENLLLGEYWRNQALILALRNNLSEGIKFLVCNSLDSIPLVGAFRYGLSAASQPANDLLDKGKELIHGFGKTIIPATSLLIIPMLVLPKGKLSEFSALAFNLCPIIVFLGLIGIMCYRYRNQASAAVQSSKAVSEEEMKQILARLSAPSESRSEEESPSLAL